jgi:hypothetical protein
MCLTLTDKYHIQMSNHAKERALERGIEMVINNPIETIYDTHSEDTKVMVKQSTLILKNLFT